MCGRCRSMRVLTSRLWTKVDSRPAEVQLVLWLLVAMFTLCVTQAHADDIQQIIDSCDQRIERHRKRDATLQLRLPDGTPLPKGTVVEVRLAKHAFLFGSNLFTFGELVDEQEGEMRRRFADVMNYATLGFYWHAYQPEQGRKLTAQRMEAAHWCLSKRIRIKGHPLIWNMEPPWVATLTEARAEQLLWDRVHDEVQRFSGIIDSWDVVNETTNGPKMARRRNATALLSAYRKHGVTGVTGHAHRLARRANPNATLILNDYDTSAAFERTLQRALDAGVDFDAIGIQSHMHQGYWKPEKVWDVCERFSRFDKPIHFTELTILSGPLMSGNDWETVRHDWSTTRKGELRQADQVRELYHLLFSHPNVEAISWWDLSDQKAWLGAPAGLLRADMTPKPAYYTVRDLVRKAWVTQVSEPVAGDGQVGFRGFYGTYSVAAEHGGRRLHGTVELRKTVDEPGPTILVDLE